MISNIGLFNESFPPVMDGVAICVENYARWMQEKVGGVCVVTPGTPEPTTVTRNTRYWTICPSRFPSGHLM